MNTFNKYINEQESPLVDEESFNYFFRSIASDEAKILLKILKSPEWIEKLRSELQKEFPNA